MKKCMLALSLLVSCAAKADMTVDIQATTAGKELKKTVTFNREVATHIVEENGIRYAVTTQEETDDAALFAVEVTKIATQEVIACPEIKAVFNQEATIKLVNTETTEELTLVLVAQKVAPAEQVAVEITTQAAPETAA